MSSVDQPRRKVARQMDTGSSLASAGRATVRLTAPLQLPARIATTVARVKDIGAPALGRPRAKLILQNDDTKPLSTNPRPGLRPALTTITPPKREGGNPFSRSRSDVGQDRRLAASRLSERITLNTRDTSDSITAISNIMALSASPEAGPSRLKYGSSGTDEHEGHTAIETTMKDRSLEEWHERPKISGGMSPRSNARTSARKARLRIDPEEQAQEAVQICGAGAMAELPDGEDLRLLSEEDTHNNADQAPDDATIEPGGEPTAVDEAKKDRKYEDLLITNRSLLILNRQHEAEVSKKDRLIANLRRQLRGSAHTEPRSHVVNRDALTTQTGSLEYEDGDSDLAPDVDNFIECMLKLETSVLRSSDKLVHMASRGAEAVQSINDITNGVKSKVLGDKGVDSQENIALSVEDKASHNAPP